MKRRIVERLQEIKRDEKRKKDTFAPIDRNFYKEVVDELEELRVKVKKYIDEGKYEEGAKLNEDILKIKNSLEEILNLRIRKILLATLSENIKTKELVKEELIFYNDVKDMVASFKNRIMRKEEYVEEPAPVPVEEKPAMKEEPKEEKEERYVLVRVLVPEIKVAIPGGRNLHLRKEDVLHIPEKMFRALIKKEKVEEIKITT